MKRLVIKNNKAASIKRRHPWVFSGAIASLPYEKPQRGEVVAVTNQNGDVLGVGHYQPNASIAVRLLDFEGRSIDLDFYVDRLLKAWNVRTINSISIPNYTNCFRLIHGEGDGLPGLVIDVYGNTAVVQCHSVGMLQNLNWIAQALMIVLGEWGLRCVYNKSEKSVSKSHDNIVRDGYVIGNAGLAKSVVLENGNQFFVDWELGQKTGFFLDQRQNRALLGTYAKNKSVLNAFSYSGGFSVYGLQNGAKQMVSVDASKKAIAWARKNVELNANNYNCNAHSAVVSDVIHYLNNTEKAKFDLMVVDPPAFAKNHRKTHNAVQGYKRLNSLAFSKIAPGGILFTFSCSQAINRELFVNTVRAATLDSGRSVRILHHLSQASDHPVSMSHPEGEYLKGLVLMVD